MSEQVVGALIAIGGAALGFALRGFVGAYVAEKGKNLATKQDVERITSQVETVKASIQTITQLRTDYEQQRREWLLTFYDTAIELHYESLAINFGDFPFNGGRSLFEYQQQFRTRVVSLLKHYQRIVLYFKHDDPLRLSSETVVNCAIDAHSVFKKRFGRVKTNLLKEEEALQSGNRDQYREATEETNEAARAFWNEMNPIVENYFNGVRVYLTHLNEFLSAAVEGPNKLIQRTG